MRLPVLTLLSSVLFFFSANSQTWQPVGPDDFNEPAFDVSTSTAITMDASGHPYVAYRDGYTSIEHVRKFNGSTWEEVGNLNITLPSNFSEVSLSIDGAGVPYIAYGDASNKPTVKKYDGSNWVDVGTAAAMTGQVFSTIGCALGVTAAGIVYAAFSDLTTSNKLALRIFHPGTDWFDWIPGGGGATSSGAGVVSLAVDNSSNHYVAFSDGSKSGAISVMKFDPGLSLVGTSGFSSGSVSATSIALDASGTPYVAFADGGNSKKIAVKKYDGANWIDVGTPGFSIGEAQSITLKIDGSGNAYVLYCDLGNSNKTIVKKFDGSNWVNAGPDITTALNNSKQRMALDAAGNPYVFFIANNLFEQKAEVKELAGGTWTTIGTKGIEEDGTRYTKMVTNSNGTPYVVYQNWTTKKATVKKYDGSSWVPVGTPGFSANGVGYTTIAISPNNIPYVFYGDQVNGATVKKFDGSNWVDVGAPGFITSAMDNTNIIVDAGGTPYIAYRSVASNKINVQKFDGSNWVNVGPADFSAGTVTYISLVLDASGTPFVAYSDAGSSNIAMVKKFDGSNWVDVGTPAITSGSSSRNSLAFDGNGTLYAAYYDGSAMVKKFDGTTWADVGTVGSGVTNVMTMGIDRNNVPYVAYNLLSTIGMTVKKYDGSNWVTVGGTDICAGKTSGSANGFYLAFGNGNVPLLSYTNGSMYVKSFGLLTVLPLRLTAFNGRIEKGDGLLNWNTDNEINTQTFIVERSTDGRKYVTTGTIQAVNESGVHQYAFTDKQVNQLGFSIIYYRLKQVDIDGHSTYSRVLMLQVYKPANAVRCYPNPVTSETNLSITLEKAGTVQARIFDNQGNVIQAQHWALRAGTSSIPVNMSSLSKGVYYLEITGTTGKKQVRLVKL
ncbi:hypothetical protein A4D02_20835 [Niastella koreensis]|uniref:Secretion system C-terminal sorting domain-containing protein n=2 Tax=Niastella koreensis TaxID=354356 RepID=G8TMV3_NIAKG|nr:T9SS type A sorting domain-containing protein [Niastella koreensis]AEV96615.1 hypothetical protein Niako_0215 [Niastella koreensis GR20-10]OQP54127.1 hypothetical protein A4D02_20835 [Niastella koreensis]